MFYNPYFSEVGEEIYEARELWPLYAAAETLARVFHDTYEKCAPLCGYETRPETRVFDPSNPNGKLMVEVCVVLLTSGHTLAPEQF